jgi:hypothetical protein
MDRSLYLGRGLSLESILLPLDLDGIEEDKFETGKQATFDSKVGGSGSN